MVLLANLRIRTLSLVGNLALGGLAILCAVVAIWSIAALGDRLTQSSKDTVPSLLILAEAGSAIADSRLLIAKHILTENPAETQQIDGQLKKARDDADQAIEQYKSLISDEKDRALYEQMRLAWAEWKEKATEVRNLSFVGRNAEATALMNANLNPLGRAADDAIDADLAHNVTLANEAGREGEELSERTHSIAIAIGVAAGAVAMLVIYLFHVRLNRPLGQLVSAMDDMAGGALDRQAPYLDRRDEMGDIGRALEGIKVATVQRAQAEAALREATQAQVVNGLADGLGALRDGRMTWRIEQAFPAEYESLRNDFNQTVAELANVLSEVTRAAQAVRVGAGEIASAATDLSVRTEGQAAALEESAAAVRQLSGTVQATATTAGEARSTAEGVQRDATDGGAVMLRAVEAIEEIARSSSKMEAIINVIDGIAFQTNLLALNAGVEAARAGDAGRGFAVVASEVRSLAQRSADAAKEIADIIRASGRDVTNGVQMIGQTQTALVQIVDRTTRLSTMIGEIAHSAVEQSEAIRQVNTVVNEMDKITQQNAALVEESTAASKSLADEAESLGGLVERFDLGTTRNDGGYRMAA